MTDDTTASEPVDITQLTPQELHAATVAAEAHFEELKEAGLQAVRNGTKPEEAKKPVLEAAREVAALRREATARRSLRLNRSFEPVEIVDLPAREDRPEEFSELFPALGVSLADRPRTELRELLDDRVAKLEAVRGRDVDIDLSRSDRKREERIGKAQVERLTAVLAGGRAVAEERGRFRRWRRKLDAAAAEILVEPAPPAPPKPRDPRRQMIVAAVVGSEEFADDIAHRRRDSGVLVDGEEKPWAGVILEDTHVAALIRFCILLAENGGTLTLDFTRQRVVAPQDIRLGRDYRVTLKHLSANDWLRLDARTLTYGPLVHEIAGRWNIALPASEAA